ncbi:MAG: benzoate-CoA ligase family protein [Rhodobacterales bacterium]|nr:benzoate-CoA ligase family protein [Rhodobacterales bacterium]
MSHANENAALYFVDRHASSDYTDKPAFVEVDGAQRHLTYGALAQSSGCVATALAQNGIHREERALLLLLDKIEFPQVFWGCLKAGVVAVPVNTLLATDVYDSILRDSRAPCLFVSAALLPVVAPLLKDAPFLRKVVVVGDEAPDSAPDNTILFADFIADYAPSDAIHVSPDEVGFWLYSSGSTGAPKGVCHVHSSLKATCDTYGAQVLQIRPDDVVYSVAKMFFAYGLGNAMSFPLSVGATTLLFSGRPTPAGVVAILEQNDPTVFCGVPTLYAATIAHLEATGDMPMTRLRLSISAGEALPEYVGTYWKHLMGVDILDGVGSTEMLHIFLSNRPDDVIYGTSGTPVPGYQARLIDDAGQEVAIGDVGELAVRGDSSANGYWNQRAKSRATFEGEWTRTGDKYERTESGRYIYCGRTDDMFKVSGIWVSPFEVEQALSAHPDILEAAVVAARDDMGLEKPKAFVVLKSDIASEDFAEELKHHVKEKIGKWKYPRWIEFVADLPKTATGKIQRFKLRND